MIAAHKPGDKIELKIYRGDANEDRHRHARAATDLPLPVAARRAGLPPGRQPTRRGPGSRSGPRRVRRPSQAARPLSLSCRRERRREARARLAAPRRGAGGRGRGALGRRRLRRLRGLVLRPHRSVPLPRGGCTFVAESHDGGAPRARLGGAGRPEPALARPAGEGGRPQPPGRLVRAVVRAERLVLRVGGGRADRCTASAARSEAPPRTMRIGARPAPGTIGVDGDPVETLQVTGSAASGASTGWRRRCAATRASRARTRT